MEIQIQQLLTYIQQIKGYPDWEDKLKIAIDLLTRTVFFSNSRIFEGAIWLYASGDMSTDEFLQHLTISLQE